MAAAGFMNDPSNGDTRQTPSDVTAILAKRGLSVVITSLDPDSWGRPFDVVERLRPIAGETIPLQAACAQCAARATRTQRLTPIIGGNMADAPENYEPRCRDCWAPPPEPAPSQRKRA